MKCKCGLEMIKMFEPLGLGGRTVWVCPASATKATKGGVVSGLKLWGRWRHTKPATASIP